MNNRLLDIQEMLFNQMKRLDNKLPLKEMQNEISRSNALSNNALTIIKSININIKLKELTSKYQTTQEQINKELGL